MRRRYPPGTEVTLNSMEGESHMPPGLKGKVDMVDDAGQIHVNWENGSSLALGSGSGQLPHYGPAKSREAQTAAIPVTNSRKSDWMIWLAGLPVIWWVAILLADAIPAGQESFRADGGSSQKS